MVLFFKLKLKLGEETLKANAPYYQYTVKAVTTTVKVLWTNRFMFKMKFPSETLVGIYIFI